MGRECTQTSTPRVRGKPLSWRNENVILIQLVCKKGVSAPVCVWVTFYPCSDGFILLSALAWSLAPD